MILSVLSLTKKDIAEIKKEQEFFDAYTIHKLIYCLFPNKNNETRQFLYSEYKKNYNEYSYLVFSQQAPIFPKYGAIQSKEISEDFLSYDYYRFRIIINPVKRKHNKAKPVIGIGNLRSWFCEKLITQGIKILEEHLEITDIGIQRIQKGNTVITHGKATFSGILNVSNRNKFAQAFQYGIGRARAFGFGLLQLVPIKEIKN